MIMRFYGRVHNNGRPHGCGDSEQITAWAGNASMCCHTMVGKNPEGDDIMRVILTITPSQREVMNAEDRYPVASRQILLYEGPCNMDDAEGVVEQRLTDDGYIETEWGKEQVRLALRQVDAAEDDANTAIEEMMETRLRISSEEEFIDCYEGDYGYLSAGSDNTDDTSEGE